MGDNLYLYSRYPMLEESQSYIDEEYDLSDMLNEEVVDRAKERIIQSIDNKRTIDRSDSDNIYNKVVSDESEYDTELISYALARLIVSEINDYKLIERYIKAEAETITENLRKDSKEKFDNSEISVKRLFEEIGINVNKSERDIPENINFKYLNKTYTNNIKNSKVKYYTISFEDYLSFSSSKQEENINSREIYDGKVIIYNISQLFEIFKYNIKDIISEDLPYDTSNIDLIEDIDLTEIKDKLVKIKSLKDEDKIDIPENQIFEALNYIDPDSNYERWRNVGFAIADYYDDKEKSKEVFKQWSKEGDKYDEQTDKFINKIIEKAGEKDEKISVGSLIHYARNNGYELDLNKKE